MVLEHLQQIRQNFVLFGEWTVTFTFDYPLFQIHFSTDSLSHSLSHLNIIYSFIIFFFLQLHIFQHFFIQYLIIIIDKKIFEEWTVANQTLWATVHEQKKKPVLERLLEHSFPLFSGFTLYFGHAFSVGDALRPSIEGNWIFWKLC